jgi:hypothetical protein
MKISGFAMRCPFRRHIPVGLEPIVSQLHPRHECSRRNADLLYRRQSTRVTYYGTTVLTKYNTSRDSTSKNLFR